MAGGLQWPAESKEGDWLCPGGRHPPPGFLNFARKDACLDCGRHRAVGDATKPLAQGQQQCTVCRKVSRGRTGGDCYFCGLHGRGCLGPLLYQPPAAAPVGQTWGDHMRQVAGLQPHVTMANGQFPAVVPGERGLSQAPAWPQQNFCGGADILRWVRAVLLGQSPTRDGAIPAPVGPFPRVLFVMRGGTAVRALALDDVVLALQQDEAYVYRVLRDCSMGGQPYFCWMQLHGEWAVLLWELAADDPWNRQGQTPAAQASARRDSVAPRDRSASPKQRRAASRRRSLEAPRGSGGGDGAGKAAASGTQREPQTKEPPASGSACGTATTSENDLFLCTSCPFVEHGLRLKHSKAGYFCPRCSAGGPNVLLYGARWKARTNPGMVRDATARWQAQQQMQAGRPSPMPAQPGPPPPPTVPPPSAQPKAEVAAPREGQPKAPQPFAPGPAPAMARDRSLTPGQRFLPPSPGRWRQGSGTEAWPALGAQTSFPPAALQRPGMAPPSGDDGGAFGAAMRGIDAMRQGEPPREKARPIEDPTPPPPPPGQPGPWAAARGPPPPPAAAKPQVKNPPASMQAGYLAGPSAPTPGIASEIQPWTAPAAEEPDRSGLWLHDAMRADRAGDPAWTRPAWADLPMQQATQLFDQTAPGRRALAAHPGRLSWGDGGTPAHSPDMRQLVAPAPGRFIHHPGLGNLTIGGQQLALPAGSSYDAPGPEPGAAEGPQTAWDHSALQLHAVQYGEEQRTAQMEEQLEDEYDIGQGGTPGKQAQPPVPHETWL